MPLEVCPLENQPLMVNMIHKLPFATLWQIIHEKSISHLLLHSLI